MRQGLEKDSYPSELVNGLGKYLGLSLKASDDSDGDCRGRVDLHIRLPVVFTVEDVDLDDFDAGAEFLTKALAKAFSSIAKSTFCGF